MRLLRLALAALVLAAAAVQAEDFTVGDIEIEGLQRIAAGTVFTYLPLEVGERYTAERSAELLRALHDTGFFDDIALYRRDDVLIVSVVERPAIDSIEFDGNSDIPSEQLEEVLGQIGIARGRVYNPSVLERLERELRQQYFARGKYNVGIVTTVEELPRNRVSIDIEISEGLPARIRQVAIVGNEDYATEALLDRMDSGVANPLVPFSSRDEYSKQRLAGDLERLRSLYLDDGYVNFRIDSTQVTITPDKRDIHITVNLTEGERYKLRSVKLAGTFVVPEDELMGLVTLEAGDVFSRRQITASTDAIVQRVGDEGYAFANVNAIPEIDEEAREVDLTLFVDPGPRVYVRRINFIGNYKTRDEVYRREMRQLEGGWYSTAKVERSKTRLQRLVYVESADVKLRRVPGTDDQVDLDITLSERLAGSFVIGAGYQDGQGLLLNVGVTEDNFLGSGNRVAINVNTSSVNRVVSFSHTNPYHTIDGVSRGYDVFYRETDTEDANIARFAFDRYGGSLRYGIPLSEFDSLRPSIGYERTRLLQGTEPSDEVIEFVQENGSTYNEYLLNLGYVYDTRDRVVFPTQGNVQSVNLEVAVPGSDLTYYKGTYSLSQYFPVMDNLTLALSGELAYGEGYGDTTELPFFEKFYAGGVRSVRGYRTNTLGPEDSLGNPFGGDFRVVSGIEAVFPWFGAQESANFRMSLFVDAGYVYEDYDAFDADEIRMSYGLGAIWLSPVGPLTFSIAEAFNDQPGDELEAFQFTLGAGF
jgi:outer membrane protein insertion porin family